MMMLENEIHMILMTIRKFRLVTTIRRFSDFRIDRGFSKVGSQLQSLYGQSITVSRSLEVPFIVNMNLGLIMVLPISRLDLRNDLNGQMIFSVLEFLASYPS